MNDPRRPSKEATDLATTYLVVTAKRSFFDYVDQIFLIIDRTDIGEGIILLLYGKSCILLTFSVRCTYQGSTEGRFLKLGRTY